MNNKFSVILALRLAPRGSLFSLNKQMTERNIYIADMRTIRKPTEGWKYVKKRTPAATDTRVAANITGLIRCARNPAIPASIKRKLNVSVRFAVRILKLSGT